AYKAGGLTPVRALLEPGAAESLVDRLGTLDQLARDRQRQIADFDAKQRRYAAEKARLDRLLARQNAQAKQLAAGKRKIEADLAKLYELRRAAYGRATEYDSDRGGNPSRPAKPGATGGNTSKVPSVSGAAGVAVRYAYGALGKPYVWAADGPNGYDCSGLTLAAWRAAGKSLPHNAAMQWSRVAHISRSALRPGDLVFYSGLGHVALYVGGGKVIHSPTFGETVRVARVDMMPPYGYGRVR
ncbi:MAG TPA: NlpC/P60 family protein, partial [Micromonospora sp.]